MQGLQLYFSTTKFTPVSQRGFGRDQLQPLAMIKTCLPASSTFIKKIYNQKIKQKNNFLISFYVGVLCYFWVMAYCIVSYSMVLKVLYKIVEILIGNTVKCISVTQFGWHLSTYYLLHYLWTSNIETSQFTTLYICSKYNKVM